MNALSKLFETLHLSRRETASRRSHRRRRTRQHRSYLSCETLEPKQLLAADVGVQFDDIVLETTDPSTVAIEGRFEESKVSSGTIVRFETNAPLSDPSFYVELTDNTPKTNENFLSYVDSGAYDNSIFHRSIDNFVIQGGGFSAPLVDANQPGSDPVSIPTTGTVDNEPFNSNDRGTIAMAKLGGQPDSATSQFFFNLSDNDFLNSDNGGYTQFGSVLGSGMTVVDVMGDALVYDAAPYYGNTTFLELPLWNVNADNIVTPDDFVKINNVEVATESTDSDLFTYTVSSSDSSKLTVTYDGNGDLVLTPVGDAAGSVDVTVTATSKLDNSTASDTFSVQLNGGTVTPVLTAIEEAGNTTLSSDQDGKLYADGQALTFGGQLTTSGYSGYDIVAVEDFGADNGGKQLVLKYGPTGRIVVWQMDDSWARAGNVAVVNATSTTQIYNFEINFNVNLDADSTIGAPSASYTDLEDEGTTNLQRDEDGKLYADGQALTFGSQLTTSGYSGYDIVAVEDFGADNGGKQLVLKYGPTGRIVIWQMDDSWARAGNVAVVNATSTTQIYNFEINFNVNLDADSTIGAPSASYTDLEDEGTTNLQRDEDGKLYADGQALTFGSQLTTSGYSGYDIVAVEDFGADNGGKQLVLKYGPTGRIVIWQMDDSWARAGNVAVVNATSTTQIYNFEINFNVNLDADSTIGAPSASYTDLEDEGTTNLQRDEDGKLYADGQALTFGSQLTTSGYSGYDIVAVEDFGADNGGKQLVLKYGPTGRIVIWQMDDSWARTGNAAVVNATSTTQIYNFETSFGVNLDSHQAIGEISSLENTGTILQSDVDGKLYADGQALTFGSQLTTSGYSGYDIVAVEDFGADNGGKQLVLKYGPTGRIVIWQMDDSWARTGNVAVVNATSTTQIYNFEINFNVNLDANSVIGPS